MELSNFDFDLPPELIADEGLSERSASRMLFVQRDTDGFEDRMFSDIVEILDAGDVLVINNTRVFPARIYGSTESGAKIEVFLVDDLGDNRWRVLAKPGRRLKQGKKLVFSERLAATVIDKEAAGSVILEMQADGDLNEIVDEIGKTPLPPYIKRDADALDRDRERYQTVYAKERGAIAAPTAGLHFTPAVLGELRSKGVTIVELTLHVGYGTFEPVRTNDLTKHAVMPERYEIDAGAVELLNAAKKEGRRIVAVGTTTTRALENNISRYGTFTAERASADLTILLGYEFKAVDALLTNFHLPMSSLLILVSAFAGHELIMKAYRHAVDERYRFYSYGDCMFIS